MTDDKLVEAVARAIHKARYGMEQHWQDAVDEATAAIAAVRQHTQNDWK